VAVDQTYQGIVLVSGKGRRLVFVIDESNPRSLLTDERLEHAYVG